MPIHNYDFLVQTQSSRSSPLCATRSALFRFALCSLPRPAIKKRQQQGIKNIGSVPLPQIEKYLKNDNEGGGRLQFFDEGCEVIEQDIILESLLLLKNRGASFCVCSDARSLPFANNTFDIATSFGVLHHIWPIEQTIAEWLRVTSGNVHFNEPNYFALTRAALLLPSPIKRKLKQYCLGDYSHSPYEDTINPYLFKKIAKVIYLSFPRSSWISSQSKGIKKVLRMINLLLVNLFPLMSSHFDTVIKKKAE